MVTEFDPIKAIGEEIAGLSDVVQALNTRVNQAEMRMGEAEIELNALRKLQGFASAELARKREVREKLVEERDAHVH